LGAVPGFAKMVVVLRRLRAGRVANSRVLLIGLAVLIATSVPKVLWGAEQFIAFDIPAQPLDAALSAFGATSGTQLLFDPDLTEGRHTNGTKGIFTAEAALRQLLAGTGVAARAIGDEGFTLVPELTAASAGDRAEISPTVQRFSIYSAAVQSAIHSALCRHAETAPGSYRVLARVWIAPSGVTDRAELLTSSGDAHRDAVLAASFRGLTIGSSPPSDLPQPVTLLVTSESVSSTYCAELRPPDRGREATR
jgi:hypothetical protein